MRRLYTTGIFAFAFVLLSAPAYAADAVTLNATADREQVALGETFQYTLEISTSTEVQPSQIKLPDFRGFQEGGRSQSEQISMSMGTGGRGFQRTKQIRVALTAIKTGDFDIPAASVVLKGNKYESRGVRVTVVQASKSAPQPRQQQGGRQGPRSGFPFGDDLFDTDPGFGRKTQVGKDDVLLKAGFDKTTAYEGERLMYVVRLFSRVSVSLESLALPKFEGFWNEDLTPTRNRVDGETREIGGVKYQVYELKRVALSPLKPGKLTIEPATIELSVSGGVFGRSVRRISDPVSLEVNALPQAGRPQEFEPGNIGQFTFKAELSSNVTGLDKPVTASFIVSGHGNMKSVKLPKIDFGGGFKSYDPTVTDSLNTGSNTGERRWDYLLIPARVGVLTVPAVTFDYFDPESASYRSITTDPMNVTVSSSSSTVALKPGAGVFQSMLASGMRPLRYKGDLRPSNPSWYNAWWVWFLIILFPGSWMLLSLGDRARAMLYRETPLSAQRRALKDSRKRLKVAGVMLQNPHPEPVAFYGELARAINGSISSRLGREPSGLTQEQLATALSETGLDASVIDRVASEIENCDFARFTPAASGLEEMKLAFDRTVKLLVELEGKR